MPNNHYRGECTMEIDELNIQAVTAFEVAGSYLVMVYPSIFQGLTIVFCGKAKGANVVQVIHDCMLCRAYGHKRCPYIKEGIKHFMMYKAKRFSSYNILRRDVTVNPKWKQIPIPTVRVERKEVKAYEPVT
ncbi:hypothetical protein [Lentibacillus salinarum]|uniref:Uncharacterized protein n=1 Tax=Lentibacillus salinarum TaxID=446820 RepID=A0ABW3ZXK5_9BACI